MKKFIWMLAVLPGLVACSNWERFYPSSNEYSLLSGFGPFDPNSKVGGVNDSDDARIPNLVQASTVPQDQIHWVGRCTPERYQQERALAMEEAKADPDRLTIPVRFSIAVGSPLDTLAYYSHTRSILRVDNPSETRIYVGPHDRLYQTGGNAFHYVTDHSKAREHFIKGERCYFDTVKITSKQNSEILFDGQPNASYRNMRYGVTYNEAEVMASDGAISPRLLKKMEDMDYSKDLQFAPVFVADLRDNLLAAAGLPDKILNPKFASSAVRGQEYSKTFREIFNLKVLWQKRAQIENILSRNRRLKQNTGVIAKATEAGNNYSAYEGVPQLIDWIIFSGLGVTVMSTRYTPIVLDLGETHIRTSSVDWGTFFNMAGLKLKASPENQQDQISHLTAWVGGSVDEVSESNDVSAIVRRRQASDGFLVVPNADGSILGPQNLFGQGTRVVIDGVAKSFDNGFLALAALGKKDCASTEIKNRYIGPWDGELYSQTLKVWVDKNRNGVAEAGEIKSLVDSKVGAMNACYYLDKVAQDKFGNTTSHRAAFLLMGENENAMELSDEIVSRITTGKRADGEKAEFRVMIDLFFQVLKSLYLEDIDPSLISGN